MRTRDENKEEAIRQKAIELIVTNGLEGFSIHKLAKAANVSPATIYIYYKDKEDLVVNITADVFNKMQEHSLRNFSSDMSFEEGLRIQWKNRATFFWRILLKFSLLNTFAIHRFTIRLPSA